MKSKVIQAAKILLSVFLFYYLFKYVVDFDRLVSIISDVNIKYVILSIVALILSVMVTAYRWKRILLLKKIEPPYPFLLKEYFIASFFNNFLPGSVGGDLVRVVGVSKKYSTKTIVLSSVVIERIVGFIGLLLIGNLGVLFIDFGDNKLIPIFSGLFFISVLAIFFVLVNKKLNQIFERILRKVTPELLADKIAGFLSCFKDYSEDKIGLIKVLLISVVFRLVEGLFVYFIVLSLKIDISYPYTVALFALISLIKFIPISMNGIGVSAVSWIYLTKTAGINPEYATSIDALTYFISLGVSLSGGILYFIDKLKSNQ